MRLIGIVSLLAACSPAMAGEPIWPQWRGPDRDGTVNGKPWPETLRGESLTEIWRVGDLGPSYSGPIVAEDRVFVTQTVDKATEVVTALDRATGKVLWDVRWDGSLEVPFFAARNGSWIRSTPAYDGESLYVAGIRDLLVCLDAETGEVRWKFDFMNTFGTALPSFGAVCSPLVDGDAVIVQAGASVVKLNKNNGEVIWRSMKDAGGMNDSAFSSPTIATLEDKRQLLVQGRTRLAGLDLETGEELWSEAIPAFRGMNILTPTVFQGKVFTSSYGGQSSLYNVSKTTDGFSVSPEWQLRREGYMSTPVVIDGHAYMHLKNRRFACIDLETGEEKWVTGRAYGEYWSLVANGDKILALDQRGDLYLIKADPNEYVELDKRRVADSESWAHLAVAGDQIFVRDLNGVTAYRWK